MSVGIPVTKGDVDRKSGEVARSFQALAISTGSLKTYLDLTPDGDLIALGYTAGEVTLLKSAISDLEQLVISIGYGEQALAAPKDFTVFLRQLWGVGV